MTTDITLHPTPELIAASVGGRSALELPFWVNEIFYSIQGEGTRAGVPCVFVRLHGCKLRCSYCDTTYAIDRRAGGTTMNGAAIDQAVRAHGCSFVEFTGGEPLEQLNTFALMEYYCDEGFTVAVETGGHVDTSACDPRVIKILDMKTPTSKMEPMNNLANLSRSGVLQPHDEVKFVIGSREDYDWACGIVRDYDLGKRTAAVLFSPVFGAIDLQALVSWILADRLPVRFQVQMHKIVWHPDTRGV
jgi:7-carboxy-7-deazaguanine synthase